MQEHNADRKRMKKSQKHYLIYLDLTHCELQLELSIVFHALDRLQFEIYIHGINILLLSALIFMHRHGTTLAFSFGIP